MDVSDLIKSPEYVNETLVYKSNDKTLDILHMNHLFDKSETENIVIDLLNNERIIYGDKNAFYRLSSGSKNKGWCKKWTPMMNFVRHRVADYLNAHNIYIHPEKYPIPNNLIVNFCSPNESYTLVSRTKDMREIGGDNEYIIVIVSLCDCYDVYFNRKTEVQDDINKFKLPDGMMDGDVLVIKGLTCVNWKKHVPKSNNSWWGLTFRFVRKLDRPEYIPYY